MLLLHARLSFADQKEFPRSVDLGLLLAVLAGMAAAGACKVGLC